MQHTQRKPRSGVSPRLGRMAWLLAVASCVALLPAVGRAQERMTFITVDQGTETRHADDELRTYLEQRLMARGGGRFDLKTYSYETVIQQLAEWDVEEQGPYVAHVTPYVYVVAEMLGADFELLGTYESRATDKTTYHSYFVVNRDDLEPTNGSPLGPDDVLEFLQRQAKPAKFIFHNKFSTSSYLLPALYFRKNRVFDMEESTEGLTAIDSEQVPGGSTNLVKAVAAASDEQVFAAVWDGTKNKFEEGSNYEAIGRRVHFIQLPTELPNDVLVFSASLGEDRKTELREILRELEDEPGEPIRSGDFRRWLDINSSPPAQEAMAGLRWLAREAPAPVTVEIAPTTGLGQGEERDWYRDAARHAVRLAGTEFVVYDPSFHRQIDFRWSLDAVRRGHVVLTSRVADVDLEEQVLPISYRPGEGQRDELTQRIGELIHSRLHRVRYLWPYEDNHPLIVRDLPFALKEGTAVKIQEITWNNHLRNQYTGGGTRTVRIAASDPFKFRIHEDDSKKLERAEAFDPMSNISYRVVLVRPREPQGWFRLFSATFYLLTLGSLVGAVVALRGPRAHRHSAAAD